MGDKTADIIEAVSQVFGAIVVGIALDPIVALIMFACKLYKERNTNYLCCVCIYLH